MQSFSTTLRVVDVRTENRGRPHQKVRFPAAPVVGRNFLTPGHPGVRVRNVREKSGPKSLCLCCFFFPDGCLNQTLRIEFATLIFGRPIFIHLQCWEGMPFLTMQHQRCIKFRVLRAQDLYTPLARNRQKGQHLPALEVYKNQSLDFQFARVSPSLLCQQLLQFAIGFAAN